MPDEIKIEKNSRFLEQYGPHFEFESKSFNYSLCLKKEAVGLQVKEIYMKYEMYMKYQFNKIFPLLIK